MLTLIQSGQCDPVYTSLCFRLMVPRPA
jgi:hypothetical protein